MAINFDRDPELDYPPEEVNPDYREVRQRRERKEAAGQIMAEPAADLHDVVAGSTIRGNRVLAEQSYTVPDGKTEAERIAIERGTKPGPVGRVFGYALGTVVAGGVLILVTILLAKAIAWAWGL